MQCNDVPNVINGSRSPAEGSLTCGSNVTYTCDKGLPIKGDIVLECSPSGQLTGQLPVCSGASGNFMCVYGFSICIFSDVISDKYGEIDAERIYVLKILDIWSFW